MRDSASAGWGSGFEFGVGEVGDLRLSGVELDDVGAVHPPDVAARAAFVQAKQGMNVVEAALVDVEGGWRELADLRTFAGIPYPFQVARGQQCHVRLLARVSVGREDASNDAAHRKGKLTEAWPPVESRQGEKEQEVLPAGGDDLLPLVGVVPTLDQPQRAAQGAEPLPDLIALGKLVLRRRPSAFFEELDERLQQFLVLVDAGLD